MVFIGFAMSIVMVVLVQAVLALPGSPAWVNKDLGYTDVAGMQNAFESVFTLPGTLVFGSMTAYLCAQLLDNRMFHYRRRRTKGRHLWLRNNASTMVSQAADTVIVNTIFLKFGLGLDWPVVGQIMFGVYIFKLLIAPSIRRSFTSSLRACVITLASLQRRQHLNPRKPHESRQSPHPRPQR